MKMYVCPEQYRKSSVKLLLCRRTMIALSLSETAPVVKLMQAVCLHQKYCPLSKRAENTDEAVKCYESISP